MSCGKLGLYIILLPLGMCCSSALLIIVSKCFVAVSVLLMGVLLNCEKCCSVSPGELCPVEYLPNRVWSLSCFCGDDDGP